MSAAETVERILALVPWLLERPGASVAEAAAFFGVDERTIVSDLDTLGYCGLPGLGGGDLFEVTIEGDRILLGMAEELRRPLRLTPDQALRLLLAGEAVAAAMADDVPALRSAMTALREAVRLPEEVAVELASEGTGWLASLREAIGAGVQVRLSYQGRSDDEPRDRLVHPRRLHVAHGHWYLVGADAQGDVATQPRTFRLDRVVDLEVTEQPAQRVDLSDVRPEYEPTPEDVDVELELGPSARWVAEAVSAVDVEELDGGRRRVRFATDAPGWVRRLVISAAPDARVVEPASLAAEVDDEVARMLELYG